MDKQDLVMHQALMKLLNDGAFLLKAREVPAFLKVYEWANKLPELISEKPNESIEEKKVKQ